jgi:AcrR family transcriptional regulator
MSSPAGNNTGPRSQRERQRAETRNRIFRAALAEFRQVGFAHAQIERIAGAAGVVRGTFYFHFPSKEHVLLELQRRVEAVLLERLDALADGGLPVAEVLAAVAEGVREAEALVGDEGLMRDVVSMYIRQPVEPDPAATPAPVMLRLAEALGGAARRGALRKDLAPERAAALVLTSVFGFYARPPTGAREHPVELDELMRVLERGLAPAGGEGR